MSNNYFSIEAPAAKALRVLLVLIAAALLTMPLTWADADGDGIDDISDFYPQDPQRAGPFRTGMIEAVDDQWQTVSLPDQYLRPIVIVGPPSDNDSEPGIVQVGQITASSFDVRFAEWRTYLDGFHQAESVPYIIAEAGHYTMEDGSIWEFGKFGILNTLSFRMQSFSNPFPGPPALFLSSQTSNGVDPYIARARNVSVNEFEVTLWEEEALNGGHGREDVGYVAVYNPQRSGQLSIHGITLPYLLQRSTLDERYQPVLSWRLWLEEEQSLDNEMWHRDEVIDAMNLGGLLFAQDVSAIGKDTATLRRIDPVKDVPVEWGTIDDVDDNWIRVPLVNVYSDPVVVVKVASIHDIDPGTLRIRDVSSDSFEVHFDEWSYQDALHGGERVFYLVADAGQHDLSGLTVEAGKLATDGTVDAGEWQTVNLTASFVGSPGVFTALQSEVDDVPTITRVEQLGITSFQLTMQEEEGSLVDARSVETLGWIAIDMGRVVTANGRSVEVLAHRVDSEERSVHLTPVQTGRFRTVVADIATTKETDAVSLRYTTLGRNRVRLMLQEEQSLDAEMAHGLEDVCVFAGE